ncbi:MAG: putative delta-60 repeat protein, partial [Luteibaculaceae bacterium]
MIQKSLLFLALTLTFVGYLEAQVTLDEHFGDQGIVVTPNTMSIDKTITTTDNKIISFGNFKPGTSSYKTVVAKYNEDGSLDTSFGDNGIRYDTDTESISSYVIAIDTLPDGSILVGGYYHYNYVDIGGVFYSVDSAFITKYKGNGSLDTSFDNTGISKYSFGSRSANVNAIVATNDNMVVGFNGDENSSGVVMLNADGSIDHSWANNGFIHFQKEKLLLYGIAQGTDGTFFCYGSNFKGFNSFGE